MKSPNQGFLSKLRNGRQRAKIFFGLKTPIQTEDREIFEREIQPYFINQKSCHRILSVGCESYTRHYNQWYQDKEFCTLDYDPKKRKYGSSQHIVDSIANVAEHFADNSLDLILCNGVYGWGLCDRTDADRAFEGCRQILKPGGILMVGWNDIEDPRYRIPCYLEDLSSIKKFDPFVFPPRSASRIVCFPEFKHIFDFFQKPVLTT